MTTANRVITDVQYRAGNEPDLLAVYLFNYVGRADLTQKVIVILVLSIHCCIFNSIQGGWWKRSTLRLLQEYQATMIMVGQKL